MHSKISAHLIGHLTADPRPFDLPRSGGAGCELRLTIARPDFDANGGRITRTRYVKAVTYDTRLARTIHSDYAVGDFVEILADDVRSEKPWYSQRNQAWMSGGVTFAITKIRKADALTPEDAEAGQAEPGGHGEPGGHAEPGADALAGVTVGASSRSAGPAANAAAGGSRPQARGSRRARDPETADAA